MLTPPDPTDPERPGTFHAAGCTPLRRGTPCAPGDRIPVPDDVEGPRPHRNVPRRRRRSPPRASAPMGGRYPPPLRRLPPHHTPLSLVRRHGQPSWRHHFPLFGGFQPPTRTIFFTTLLDDTPPRSSHGVAAPRQHARHLPTLEKSSIATWMRSNHSDRCRCR